MKGTPMTNALLCTFLSAVLSCAAPPSPVSTTESSAPHPVAAPRTVSEPRENWDRDVVSTALDVDLATRTATARIVLAPSPMAGASLEIGGLEIERVVDSKRDPVTHTVHDGQIDLDLPPNAPAEIHVTYRFRQHAKLQGLTPHGTTFSWPNFCGNLFPCRSTPSDGVRLSLEVHGAKPGGVLVFPKSLPLDAPAYMLAWAHGDYTRLDLGASVAGTRVAAYYLPGEKAAATKGTEPLRDAFDWLEKTYGAYAFGSEVGSVSADWDGQSFGGMEHHPFWHVARGSMGDTEAHVHEATHGWFGNGVRIACWEDLTLSEGTTSYLTARAFEAVRGKSAGDAVWARYGQRLDDAIAGADRVARPEGCNRIDVLEELFGAEVYVKGAFFYRDVERAVGRAALDGVLARFYMAHRGRAAGMADMLAAIRHDTGFDPTPLATGWLSKKGRPDRSPLTQ